MPTKRPLILGLLVLSSIQALGELITFDQLPTNGTIPNGYQGFQWFNTASIDAVSYTANGFNAGLVSQPRVAYTSTQGLVGGMMFPVDFTLNSGYFTAAYRDDLLLTVTGFNNNVQVFQSTQILSATAPTFVTFDWQNVDYITFQGSGGTQHPGYDVGNAGTSVVIDNIAFVVPEPQTALLLLVFCVARAFRSAH